MFKKLGLLALCGASAFAMHSVELNINDKDLEFGGALDMGQFYDTVKPDTVFIGVKFLHGDDGHSDIPSSDEMHDYYEINFLMKRNINESDLTIGLGVKLNGTKDFSSVPLGAEIRYKLPISEMVPLYVGGSVYYAPEVLSMQDAKNFLEYRIGFDVEVIENACVSLGYRSIDTNYDTVKGNLNYNKSLHVGFKFAF